MRGIDLYRIKNKKGFESRLLVLTSNSGDFNTTINKLMDTQRTEGRTLTLIFGRDKINERIND